MKVLLVASEVSPIIKLGGLGDVIGSLPKALEKLGVDVDVVVPFYPSAKLENLRLYKSLDISVPFANETHNVEAYKTKLPNSEVDVILLKNPYFISGGGSAFARNRTETEMFSFFCRSVVEMIKCGFNTYDLIHCNDWHTGLITHILSDEVGETRPATLLTVHNLSYQGVGGVDIVQETGFVPGEHPLIDWDTQDGDINFLLQGIASSDFINTVSPSYAKEILSKDIGGEMADILKSRVGRLVGILNGIDYSFFPRDFDADGWKLKKRSHKKKLQKKLALREDFRAPLFAFVGRLDPKQKGMDILFEVVPEIARKGGQFILLGTGDSEWEKKFQMLLENEFAKDAISINIEFNVDLANQVYSGSDFLVIPSKFEPCGLIQMIAMWYGCLPIAHATGGLKDSIEHGKTGFLFQNYASEDLLKAVEQAGKIYGSGKYAEMVEEVMRQDFGWDKSAKKYLELYEKVVQIRKHVMEG